MIRSYLPRSFNDLTMQLPIKPAPPVTRILICPLSVLRIVYCLHTVYCMIPEINVSRATYTVKKTVEKNSCIDQNKDCRRDTGLIKTDNNTQEDVI